MEELSIISDPRIMLGKPIIKGTRITVGHILNEIANGLTIEQILTEYPHLTHQEVVATTLATEHSACLRKNQRPSSH